MPDKKRISSFAVLRNQMISQYTQIWMSFIQDLKSFTYIVIVIDVLQVLSFSFSILPKNPDYDITWYRIYQFLFIFARPSYILQKNQVNIFDHISFAILSLIVLGIITISITVLVGFYKKRAQFKQVGVFFLLLSFFNSLFHVPLQDLALYLSIQGSFGEGLDINIIERSILNVYSVFFVILSYFCSSSFELSYNLNQKNLLRSKISRLNMVLNLSKSLIILINNLNPRDEKTVPIIVTTLTLIFFSLRLIESLFFWPISNLQKIKFYASLQYYGLLMVIFKLFEIILSEFQDLGLFTCFLLLYPLGVKLIFSIKHRQFQVLVFESESRSANSIILQKKILLDKIQVTYSNLDYVIREEQIRLLSLIDRHAAYCTETGCFCKSVKTILGGDGTSFLISKKYLQQYLLLLVKNDISNTLFYMDLQNNFIKFVQYQDFLMGQGKDSYSIQKIIEFINENDKMKRNVGRFIEVSLETLLEVVRTNMHFQLKKGVSEQKLEQTMKDIDDYIRIKIEQDQIKEMILQCLEIKMECFQKMQKGFVNISQIEDTNKLLQTKFEEIEKRSDTFYDQHPILKNQAICCLFHAEVKGDMLRAHEISKKHKFNTSQLNSINKDDGVFDVFDREVYSLTITFGKAWGQIVSCNDRVAKLLSMTKQELAYLKDIREVMPITVSLIHNDLIQYLLTTGDDRVVHSKRDILIKNKLNMLLRVEAFFSLNIYHPVDFPYIVFLKEFQSRSGHFIVNMEGKINGFDKRIFEMFKYNDIIRLPNNINLDVKYLIPNWDEIRGTLTERNNIYENKNLRFQFFSKKHQFFKYISAYNGLKDTSAKAQNDHNSYQKSVRSMNSNASQNMNKEKLSQQRLDQNMIKLNADIIIHRRGPLTLQGPYIYYIIEIRKLFKKNKDNDNFGQESLGSQYTLSQQFTGSQFTKSMKSSEDARNGAFSENESDHLRFSTLGKENGGGSIGQRFGDKLVNPRESGNIGRGESDYMLLDRSSLSQKPQDNVLLNSQNQFQATQNYNPFEMDDLHVENRNKLDIEQLGNESARISTIQDEIVHPNIQTTRQAKIGLNNDDPENDLGGADATGSFRMVATGRIDETGRRLLGHGEEERRLEDISVHVENQSQQSLAEVQTAGHWQIKGLKKQEMSQLNLPEQNEFNNKLTKKQVSQITAQSSQSQQAGFDRSQLDRNPQEERQLRSETMQSHSERLEIRLDLLGNDPENGLGGAVGAQQPASVSSNSEQSKRSLDKYFFYREFIFSSEQLKEIKLVSLSKFLQFLMLLTTILVFIFSTEQQYSKIKEDIDIIQMDTRFAYSYGNLIALSYSLDRVADGTLVLGGTQSVDQIYQRIKLQFEALKDFYNEGYQNEYQNEIFSSKILAILDIYNRTQFVQRSYFLNSVVNQLIQHAREIYQQTNEYIQADFPRHFIYANFYSINEFFEELLGTRFDDQVRFLDQRRVSNIIQSTMICLCALVLIFFTFFNYHKNLRAIQEVLYLTLQVKQSQVETEVQRLNTLYRSINEDEEILFYYQFDLREKERLIYELQKKGSQQQQKSVLQNQAKEGERRKIQKVQLHDEAQSLRFGRFVISNTVFTIMFLIYIWIIFSINIDFISRFEPAIDIYHQTCLASTALPKSQALEIQLKTYRDNPLENASTTMITSAIRRTLSGVANFNEYFPTIKSLRYFDSSFSESAIESLNSDICETADDFDPGYCVKVKQAILTRGVLNTFTKWNQDFQAKLAQNFPPELDTQNYMELPYIAIATSDRVRSVLKNIRAEIEVNTYDSQNQIYIYSIVFFLILIGVFINDYIKESQINILRFQDAKKSIFMAPLYCTLIDDTYFKILRAVSNKLNITK